MSKTYSDGSTPNVTYTYDTGPDGKGRLSSVANGNSTTDFLQYDALGNVLASSQTTAGRTYGFAYTYNLAGSLMSEAYPSGRTVTTSYDGANRATSVTGNLNGQQTPYVSGAVYAPQDVPSFYGYANQVIRTITFNSRLQWDCAQDVWQNSPSSYLWMSCPNWSATNDNGNLQSVTTYAGGPAALSSLPAFTTTFGYDGVNRLSTANDSGGWSRAYGYDPYGNMWVTGYSGVTPLGNIPTSNVYASNRINGASYDSAGNQTVVSGDTLAYDAENRIVSAYDPVTHGTETYVYDGDGRRVEKSGPGGTTTYVYDAFGNLAAEYGAMQGNPPCTTCYLSYDWLGSVRMMTDASGNVVARHDFLPFGQEVPGGTAGRNGPWGSTSDVEQKFTGQIRDTETGMDYFGARYYGNALGRFTSPDPLGGHLTDPQTLNRYAYVRNNPLRFTDPTGMYVTNCRTGDKACARNAAAFEKARQHDLKSKNADIRAAAAAYGDQDKTNGVTVAFSNPSKGKNGTATPTGLEADPDHPGKYRAVVSVVIRPGESRTDLDTTVGHEGQHVEDVQGFAATVTPQGYYDLSKNLTELQTEINAYRISNAILSEQGVKAGFGTCGDGPCVLGYGVTNPDATIKQLLANPANGYGVTEANPGPRQFPEITSPNPVPQ